MNNKGSSFFFVIFTNPFMKIKNLYNLKGDDKMLKLIYKGKNQKDKEKEKIKKAIEDIRETMSLMNEDTDESTDCGLYLIEIQLKKIEKELGV